MITTLTVPKSKIAHDADYNLSQDRYRVSESLVSQIWPVVKLNEACDIFNGSTPSRSELSYWEHGSIPWFTVDDIREQGRIISYTKQKITNLGLTKSSVKLLPKHSVLLCCTASVGEYAFTEIELTTNQQFNGLVVKNEYKHKLLPKFLFQLVSTFKKELERLSGKTSFNFVSVGTLKKIEIPIPPLDVQQEIIDEIEGYQNTIFIKKNEIKQLEGSIKTAIDKVWGE